MEIGNGSYISYTYIRKILSTFIMKESYVSCNPASEAESSSKSSAYITQAIHIQFKTRPCCVIAIAAIRAVEFVVEE